MKINENIHYSAADDAEIEPQHLYFSKDSTKSLQEQLIWCSHQFLLITGFLAQALCKI